MNTKLSRQKLDCCESRCSRSQERKRCSHESRWVGSRGHEIQRLWSKWAQSLQPDPGDCGSNELKSVTCTRGYWLRWTRSQRQERRGCGCRWTRRLGHKLEDEIRSRAPDSEAKREPWIKKNSRLGQEFKSYRLGRTRSREYKLRGYDQDELEVAGKSSRARD